MARRVLVTGGSGFIGTNLVAHLAASGDDVESFDLAAPRDPANQMHHHAGDLLDSSSVANAVATVRPTHVVHLGARTDLGGTSVNDYLVNTVGTQNLFAALDAKAEVERIVVASSLLVCRNGYRPSSDIDYCPTTAYGESKQQMEQWLRSERADDDRWTIARPTSIWGPWFGDPYRRFFETVATGRYVHPGRPPVTKALGYVANTVRQLDAMLSAPTAAVSHATMYLADEPEFTIDDWANAIADAAGVRRPRTVPLWMLKPVARIGDLAQRTGKIDPPLTSFRLTNMRTPSGFDLEPIGSVSEPPATPWRVGVAQTVEWLQTH